ncbi:MAG TPA: hypothetical protein VJ936_05750 [Desulfobacteraceae bacterium]|nr:hypothetical protein [Desulfobacteraceae bacterium]
MELLILKSGKSYIRVKEEHFLVVDLDKASVFPMDQIKKVLAFKDSLNREGFRDACIKKLVLTEEDV